MKSKKIFFISIAALFSIALVLGAVYFLGRYEIVDRTSRPGSVCGDDIIKKYNDLYDNPDTSSDKYKQLTEEIKNKEGYTDDVDCMYVTFLASSRSGDPLDDSYSKSKKFIEEGYNPSLKLKDIYSLDGMTKLKDVQGDTYKGAMEFNEIDK